MLEEILGSPTKIRILRVLWVSPHRERTIRELARALGLSVGTVHPAVGQLAGTHVIRTRRTGRAVVVSANPAHVLYSALASLFRAEATAFVPVAEAFAESLPSQGLSGVVLYGSVARGEAGPRSDVDVLVVVDDLRRAAAIRTAAAAMTDRVDANVVPLVLTRAEVDRRLRAFDPLLLTIAAEGRRLRGRVSWLGP